MRYKAIHIKDDTGEMCINAEKVLYILKQKDNNSSFDIVISSGGANTATLSFNYKDEDDCCFSFQDTLSQMKGE